MRYLAILFMLLWTEQASAQIFVQLPYGYGYAPQVYQYYEYTSPQPRLNLTPAQRWERKLEGLEAQEAYNRRASQVWLDRKEQGLNNFERAKQLDQRERQIRGPAPVVRHSPMDERSQVLRQTMGEEWWKQHGWKVAKY